MDDETTEKVMGFKTAKEIVQHHRDAGPGKVALGFSRLLVLGFLAGAYIAFGGVLALKVGGGVPGLKTMFPGLVSFIFGAVFPVGLMFVILAGAELFTGNTALMMPALIAKKIRFKGVLRNWFGSYVGNFLGSIFVAYVCVHLTGILSVSPWEEVVQELAVSKVQQPVFTLFLKAVACNWLVCLAIWLATASNQVGGKILGIWFPIMAFVALGFEHSVANMFFIPLGIFEGAPVGWADFLVYNLLPVTLGNVVGGVLFVGGVYGLLYAKD